MTQMQNGCKASYACKRCNISVISQSARQLFLEINDQGKHDEGTEKGLK